MLDKKFRQGDGLLVSYKEMVQHIADYILVDTKAEYEITVGTDSQNHSQTKMVEVIAVRRIGKGGIFFYHIETVKIIKALRDKIVDETNRSLENAKGLLDEVQLLLIDKDVDIDKLNINFVIHCDIGYQGRTQELITEIVSWVHSMGYECQIKPDSYTASGIANKFSK